MKGSFKILVFFIIASCSSTKYYAGYGGPPRKIIQYHVMMDFENMNAMVYFKPIFNSVGWGYLTKDSSEKNTFHFKNSNLSHCIKYRYLNDSEIPKNKINILLHSNLKVIEAPYLVISNSKRQIFGKRVSDTSALFSLERGQLDADSTFQITFSEFNVINMIPSYISSSFNGGNMLDIAFQFPVSLIDLNRYSIFQGDLIIKKRWNGISFSWDGKRNGKTRRRTFRSRPAVMKSVEKRIYL